MQVTLYAIIRALKEGCWEQATLTRVNNSIICEYTTNDTASMIDVDLSGFENDLNRFESYARDLAQSLQIGGYIEVMAQDEVQRQLYASLLVLENAAHGMLPHENRAYKEANRIVDDMLARDTLPVEWQDSMRGRIYDELLRAYLDDMRSGGTNGNL